MNYFILILIILVSVCLIQIRGNKEYFSILACPINPYITDRTPTEYIFSGNHQVIKNNCDTDKNKIEGFTNSVVGNKSVPRQIWIFYPFEKNSREWLDWGSRLYYESNTKLFDLSVQNLKDRTGWNIVVLHQKNMNQYIQIPSGLEDNELYIQAKILYQYGGLWLPAYSFPIKNIDNLRNKIETMIMPYIEGLFQVLPIMCIPGLKIWSQMSEYIINNPNRQPDYSDFNHLYYLANCNNVRLVDGRVFGMLDKKGRMITFLNLVSDTPPELTDDTFIVCINKIEEGRLNTQYVNYNAWFNQLVNTNTP